MGVSLCVCTREILSDFLRCFRFIIFFFHFISISLISEIGVKFRFAWHTFWRATHFCEFQLHTDHVVYIIISICRFYCCCAVLSVGFLSFSPLIIAGFPPFADFFSASAYFI